ncbi:MAG: GNAT family N-acetyltransferase [Bacteroidaceae bacterium]|nr:GNAT family N-acetyltransferase [Bacteroidaceae bacterium]
MNIEQVREYTLSLNGVTEDQPFGDDLITFRLEGKIFLCLNLGGDEHDPEDSALRMALKLSPERNEELRELFPTVKPAYHWNKKHWSDVYYEQLEETQVKEWIRESYQLVASKLPKAIRNKYIPKLVLHRKWFSELTLDELYELLRIRSEVFVVEQNCVYQDMDGDDQKSYHLWLTMADKIIALARVCPADTHMNEISIGRVITTERGKGYGKQIMLHAIEAAKEHFRATQIDIEAQEYAKGFYESVGFKQSSEPFMLDGIPHIKMTWTKESTD